MASVAEPYTTDPNIHSARRCASGASAWQSPLHAAIRAAILSKTGRIFWQAVRARASHFNVATPFEALIYGTIIAFGALMPVEGIVQAGGLTPSDAGAGPVPLTVLFAALTLAIFAQALAGQPLVRLG